jgi:hypothetical protein
MRQTEALAELAFETFGVPAFSTCNTAVATVMGNSSACGFGTSAVFVEVCRERNRERSHGATAAKSLLTASMCR